MRRQVSTSLVGYQQRMKEKKEKDMTSTNTAQTLKTESKEKLISIAQGLKLELTGDEDVTELIGMILENQGPAVVADAVPGILISIRTHTEDAKAFVLKGRNHIAQNEKGGHRKRCFLKNRDGNLYSKTYPGVELTKATFQKLVELEALSPLPDGSQAKLIEELKTDFESFQEVLLVRVSRPQDNGRGGVNWNQFVMLYAEKKQVIAESVF